MLPSVASRFDDTTNDTHPYILVPVDLRHRQTRRVSFNPFTDRLFLFSLTVDPRILGISNERRINDIGNLSTTLTQGRKRDLESSFLVVGRERLASVPWLAGFWFGIYCGSLPLYAQRVPPISIRKAKRAISRNHTRFISSKARVLMLPEEVYVMTGLENYCPCLFFTSACLTP